METVGNENTTTDTIDNEDAPTTTPRTYTQEELDVLLQKESDRRVSDALKKKEKQSKDAVKEASRLAQMSAQEKLDYEMKQWREELDQRERDITLLENKNECAKILSDKGISLSLVQFVVAEDSETMMENINTLDKAFKASVKVEVDRRIKGNTPKHNLPMDQAVTKDSFQKMTILQRSNLKSSNPEIYRQLSQ